MSLLPYLFGDSYLRRPTRILDQHFGLALDPEDILQPLELPRLIMRGPAGYIRNWRSSSSDLDYGSTVSYDNDKFQANLDVQQFKPEEISVKVTGDRTVTIEGKHEQRDDEHGQVYRRFVRRYIIPKNCDVGKIESNLSTDGILTVSAPIVDKNQIEHKNIPITQTGEPEKPIEKKRKKNSGKCETQQRYKK